MNAFAEKRAHLLLLLVLAVLQAGDVRGDAQADSLARLSELVDRRIETALAPLKQEATEQVAGVQAQQAAVRTDLEAALGEVSKAGQQHAADAETRVMKALANAETRLSVQHAQEVTSKASELEKGLLARIQQVQKQVVKQGDAQKQLMEKLQAGESSNMRQQEQLIGAEQLDDLEKRLQQRIEALQSSNEALSAKLETLSVQFDSMNAMYENLQKQQIRFEEHFSDMNGSSWQAWARSRANLAARNLGHVASYLQAQASGSMQWWNTFYDANLADYGNVACNWGQDVWNKARPTVDLLVDRSSLYAGRTRDWAAKVHQRWRPSLDAHVQTIRSFLSNWGVSSDWGLENLVTVESLTAFVILLLALLTRLLITLMCNSSKPKHGPRRLASKKHRK